MSTELSVTFLLILVYTLKVLGDGGCFFHSTGLKMDTPFKYTSTHLRRHLRSFQSYLQYMLEDDSWADEVVIHSLSLMFQVTITILRGHDLTEVTVRHGLDITDVDLLYLYWWESLLSHRYVLNFIHQGTRSLGGG